MSNDRIPATPTLIIKTLAPHLFRRDGDGRKARYFAPAGSPGAVVDIPDGSNINAMVRCVVDDGQAVTTEDVRLRLRFDEVEFAAWLP